MIAAYPDRIFQLWEYRVSHGSLLIRSPKGPEAESNVDLIFVGVDYLAVPHSIKGVAVDRGTAEDVAAVAAAFGEVSPERVFALSSQGRDATRSWPLLAESARMTQTSSTARSKRSSAAARQHLQPGLGDEGVDEAGDEVEVFVVEFGDGGDAVVAEGGFVGGAPGA